MSAPRKAGKNREAPCCVLLWKICPHLFLSLSLVGYAALGALLFKNIEGRKEPNSTDEYHEFLGQIVQNITNSKHTQEDLVVELEQNIKNRLQLHLAAISRKMDFFGSMFFCCTVFTTVGYGEIYPVTLLGKVVCILYAMVGIPLMLLVMSDVGDVLAVLLSRAYRRIHKLGKALCYRSWSPNKASKKAWEETHHTLEDGTFVFSHGAVMRQPMDIGQVLQNQKDLKQKLTQLNSNKEIFEKILARENFLCRGPLLRSLSCPELDRMPRPPKDCAMWDFSGIGTNMDGLDVPFVLILLVVVTYILLGGLILPLWETDFEGFDPYYFCFITLTTIGFGDIVPKHPKYFMITSLFIIVGMAIMSMAFKLGQTRIVSFYHTCIRFMSRGHVVTMHDQEMMDQSEGYL
uniref:Potassium channel, subfamily K, member 18 n=1 Tax=Gadus morhua TaxID=8049 RepID=A0A8C5CRB5_GADMO